MNAELTKKALEKEGITKDRVFISESVSEIKYTRPGKFEEKVIAVYTNGNNRNTSPNAYVFGSLYEPEIAETVKRLVIEQLGIPEAVYDENKEFVRDFGMG